MKYPTNLEARKQDTMKPKLIIAALIMTLAAACATAPPANNGSSGGSQPDHPVQKKYSANKGKIG